MQQTYAAHAVRQPARRADEVERDGGWQNEWIMPEREHMSLAGSFPHVPHDQSGECCGCIRPVEMDGRTIELRCNECGAIVGVLDRGVLEDLVWLVNARKVDHA